MGAAPALSPGPEEQRSAALPLPSPAPRTFLVGRQVPPAASPVAAAAASSPSPAPGPGRAGPQPATGLQITPTVNLPQPNAIACIAAQCHGSGSLSGTGSVQTPYRWRQRRPQRLHPRVGISAAYHSANHHRHRVRAAEGKEVVELRSHRRLSQSECCSSGHPALCRCPPIRCAA